MPGSIPGADPKTQTRALIGIGSYCRDDDAECVEDNTGHIASASAFMMISELPTDSESEFMVTVCTAASRDGTTSASCNLLQHDAMDEVITREEIIDAQARCPHCIKVRNSMKQPNGLWKYNANQTYVEIDDMPCMRMEDSKQVVVAPTELRDCILHAYHYSNLACHSGRHAVIHEIKLRYFWPGMYKDVREHIQNCYECTVAKTSQPLRHGLMQQTLHDQDMSMLGMYLVGPLPT